MKDLNESGSDLLERAIREFRDAPVPQRPPGLDELAVSAPRGGRDGGAGDVIGVRAAPLRPGRFGARRLLWAAAASVLLAACIGSLIVGHRASMAFADVVAAAEEHRVVRYVQTQVTEMSRGAGSGRGETVSIVYADLRAARFRTESKPFTDSGEVPIVSVQDGLKKRSLMLNSQTKIATVLPADNTKPFLDSLRAFQDDKRVSSVKSELNGRTVMRYRREDGGTTTVLWIDPKTQLPVRLEYEMAQPTPDILVNKWVLSDFEWEPDVGNVEQLFDTTPPAGYVIDDKLKDAAGPATAPSSRRSATSGPASAPSLGHTTPDDAAAAMRDLERRVQEAARRVMPAVVAVEQADGGIASGVIISDDGLVLSQYHVSHQRNSSRAGLDRSDRRPGERINVFLQDGRQARASLLGANLTYDLSLLRLLDPGPHPHTPLTDGQELKLGDPVLVLGHPAGYKSNALATKTPVLRLRFGRVLCRTDESIVTDCRINGGDSGGPLYDVTGRLVGLNRCSALTHILKSLEPAGEGRAHSAFFAYNSGAAIRSQLEALLRGEVSPFDRSTARRLVEELVPTPRLPPEQWTAATAPYSAQVCRDAARDARSSVVLVTDGAQPVALGTVVAEDGFVVTSAGRLPVHPRCRLHDGTLVNAKVVHSDPAANLALLKVDAAGLRPIDWRAEGDVAVGSFVITPGLRGVPLAMGVIGTPRRDSRGPAPSSFDHDMPLRDDQCGGPVLDLAGRVLGVTVDVAVQGGGIAIPTGDVQQFFRRWRGDTRAPCISA